jgi:hypothetical protein
MPGSTSRRSAWAKLRVMDRSPAGRTSSMITAASSSSSGGADSVNSPIR